MKVSSSDHVEKIQIHSKLLTQQIVEIELAVNLATKNAWKNFQAFLSMFNFFLQQNTWLVHYF